MLSAKPCPNHRTSPHCLMLSGNRMLALSWHQFSRLVGCGMIEPCAECTEMFGNQHQIHHISTQIKDMPPEEIEEECFGIIEDFLH